MKDKIEQILRDNLVVSGSGLSILGTKGATNKLIELMCYREVRAIFKSMEGALMTAEDLRTVCIEVMIYCYPEVMILAAIEKYKTDQP